MKYNRIKKFLIAMMLVAFTLPSGFAGYYETYGPSQLSSTTLSSSVRLSKSNERITLSLRDSDITQVLRMFADKAGLNVVFHESVEGKVTLDLVDMPINEAFNLILSVKGLNYYIQNNTLIVIAKDDEANAMFSKQEMMVFPIKYVAAGKIAEFLNANVFSIKKTGISGVDAATVNAATNELIVFGMPSDGALVRKVIAQFDREPLSRTFIVNHTTPKEMAEMICNVLLPSRGSAGGVSSNTINDGRGNKSLIASKFGKSAIKSFQGVITGAAADSSSSGTQIKLGEGVMACSVSTSGFSSKTATPFDVQNLSISYYPQRGSITVLGGSVEQQKMIDEFIRENDVKQPQAYLEISIIELTEDGSRELSNTWKIDSKNWLFSFSGDKSSIGREATPGTRKFIPVKFLSDDGRTLEDGYIPQEQWYGNNAYISWQLNYLIENRKGRVLANPKLLVTNGEESVIDLTQDYVEKVTSEYLSSMGTGATSLGTAQKQYTIGKDLGIKVALTPFISPSGYVTMNIKPEYSTPYSEVYSLGQDGVSKQLDATLLSRRNLDLKNVRIKDGETLVIGGLIQESDKKTTQKIPVLGDLPVIGSIFRSSTTTKSKSELLILLTPRIINDGDDSVLGGL